jgi:fatty acid desaturase
VLNDVFGNLFGFIIMLPHVYFRWEHTEHHTYTQVSGRDPQLISQPKSLWQYLLYLSTIPYWLGFLRPFVRHVIGIIPPNERRFIPATETWKVVWEARAMFVAYAGLLIVSLWLRTEVLWFYWLGPRLLGEPFMRFIRMSEHVGRPVNEPDLLQNSRTCIVWAPLRWLAWNMPYHAEHHLSPGVPFHALPALHRELRAVPRPITAGYHGAHREILGRVLHADAVAVSPS